MNITLLSFTILALLLTIVLGSIENNTRYKKYAIAFIICIGLSNIISVILQAIDDAQEDKKNEAFNKEIKRQSEKILMLQHLIDLKTLQIEKQNDTIVFLERSSADSLHKVSTLQKQINILQKQTKEYIEGSDTDRPFFAYLIKPKNDGSHEIIFAIDNCGKLPMGNVKYSFRDNYTYRYKYLKEIEGKNLTSTEKNNILKNLEQTNSLRNHFGSYSQIIGGGREVLFTVYIPKDEESPGFDFSVSWNNRKYWAYYDFEKINSKMVLKKIEIDYKDHEFSKLKNLKDFFCEQLWGFLPKKDYPEEE